MTSKVASGLRQFELPLINVTLWIMIGAFVSALFINLFVQGYDRMLNVIFGVGLALTLLMMYYFRKDRFFRTLKLILIVVIWATFNVSWFFNHGFNRTVIILFAFFFTFLIFIQNNKGIIICTLLMIINLAVLFMIQSRWPELLEGESSEIHTKVDVIYTLIVGWIMIPAYIYIAKSRYLKEYHKALKSEELKSSFLANMSHEIRTPLNAIMGFSELIKEDENEMVNRHYLDLIYSNSNYLHELIDQVLNISLIESGNLAINKQVVSLNALIDRLIADSIVLLDKDRESKIQIISDLTDENLHIYTDKVQLEQVLRNLLTNAIKFTQKGSITIGAKMDNHSCHFYVSDTGKGISPDHIDTVFDRFVKLSDYSHSRSRGAGLGLYLCKQIVEKLDGTISVESVEDRGSTFSFSLPSN